MCSLQRRGITRRCTGPPPRSRRGGSTAIRYASSVVVSGTLPVSSAADIVWRGVASEQSGEFSLSVTRSETEPARWMAHATWSAVNQHLGLSFAIAGPDDVRRVKDFLDKTYGRDFEDRVQVVFGSLYGRPLRLVKNSPDRGEGYFVDASAGGVTGGDDAVVFFLNDEVMRHVSAAVRQVVARFDGGPDA